MNEKWKPKLVQGIDKEQIKTMNAVASGFGRVQIDPSSFMKLYSEPAVLVEDLLEFFAKERDFWIRTAQNSNYDYYAGECFACARAFEKLIFDFKEVDKKCGDIGLIQQKSGMKNQGKW